jgi:polyisoprenoid-binding protein YceI
MVPNRLKRAKLRRIALSAAGVLAVLLPACGMFGNGGSSNDMEAVRPEEDMVITRQIDPLNSFVVFTGQAGSDAYQGKFEGVQGTVTFPENAAEGDLTGATVRVTMQTDLLRTQHNSLSSRLLGGDFLDAKEHPTVEFSSESIRKKADGEYAVDGLLTLKGKEQQLEFDARLNKDVLLLTTVVDRDSFDLGTSEENQLLAPIIPVEARITLLP